MNNNFRGYRKLGAARAGGFAAEQAHAEFYNLSAKLHKNKVWACAIDDNKLTDVFIGGQQFQLKFMKTPEETFREISQTFFDHYKSGSQRLSFDEWINQISKKFDLDPEAISKDTSYYQNMKTIVPSDQLQDIRQILGIKINSAGKAGNLLEAERLSTIKYNLTDKLSNGSAE